MNRCLAYARAVGPRAGIRFFSLASAIDCIEDLGFEAEYFVSPNWTSANAMDWNRELALRLGMFFERIRPDAVVFDGTWPYQGLAKALRAYSKARSIWSYRGLHQLGRGRASVDSGMFDLVIRPGELGDCRHEGLSAFGNPQLVVPPVCLLQEHELLDRQAARQGLGLGEGRHALFSLGAGNINDLGDPAWDLVRLLREAGYHIVWACNPISVVDVDLPAYVQPVSVYPLVRYFRAFDVFVGAAGYNTCCEVVQARVPALLVPNVHTKLDDQVRRAELVALNGPAVVSTCETAQQRESAVLSLLELLDDALVPECALPLDGASQAADAIMRVALGDEAW